MKKWLAAGLLAAVLIAGGGSVHDSRARIEARRVAVARVVRWSAVGGLL